MNYDYKAGWRVATDNQPFDAKADYVDNGTARPDPARYYDPAVMRAEWDRMWTRVWLIACPSSDLREAGDYVRFDVGPESIVVVRAENGAARAFYNVCPHRGNRLVHDDFGSVREFACSFHSWKFNFDGVNTQVTDTETFRPEVLCHDKNLTAVKCEEACGLVFVSMNPDIEPVRDWLGVVAGHLDAYDISRMHTVQHKRSEWAANWKTGIDAFYEVYHLHAVHPQTQGMMEDYYVQLDLYRNGMSRMYIPFARPSPRVADQITLNDSIKFMMRDAGIDPDTFQGTAADARQAIQLAKRERAARVGLDYGHFTDGQLTDSVPYGIFPNVQIGCHPEGVFLMRFLPHPTNPEQFTYDNIILYRHVDAPGYFVPAWMGLPPDTDTTGAVRPDVIHVPLGVSPQLGEVLDQDSELLPVVQKGLHSRGFKGPLWGEQEQRVRHFHAELDRYLAGRK